MKNIIITENQLRLLINNSFDLIKEEKRPLEKLKECIISEDYKYIVYDNNLYDSQTGDLIPISEGWSLSDILHTGADVLSVAADFVGPPGSGAIIDTLNALSYVIEAQFKTGPEQDKLYLMAAITFAFVVLPGPLQTLATPLKRAIKTGAGFASKAVVKGLKIIGGILDTILLKIPSAINKALKSPLAKKILGKFSGKISKFFQAFTSRIRKILAPLTKAGKQATKKVGQKVGQKIAKGTVTNVALQAAKKFFQKIPKMSQGGKILRKAGFAPGFSYRYMSKKGATTTAKVMKVSDNGVLVMFKNGNQMMVPVSTFVSRAVGAPWLRRGAGTLVPLFIKRFFDVITPDGSDIDYKKLDQLKDLDPAQTSKESLDYLMEEVADYEGDAGTYNVSTNVTDFQNALELLGYKLVRAGADGKFGPETKEQLTKFQNDNKLTSSIGKMDRVTARKLAELLKTKNIPNSLDLQNKLNKV
jgi:hypothetical protein